MTRSSFVARYNWGTDHVFYMKKPRRSGGDTLGTRLFRIHAPKSRSVNTRVALVPHTWGAPGRASRASPPRTFRGARRPADRATFLRVGGARNHVAGCPAKTPERRARRPGQRGPGHARRTTILGHRTMSRQWRTPGSPWQAASHALRTARHLATKRPPRALTLGASVGAPG